MKILFVQTNYPGFLNEFYTKHPNWQKLSYKKLKSFWVDEWFGSSNFYSKYLNRLGNNCDEVIINDWNMQSKWAEENDVQVNKLNLPLVDKLPELVKNQLGLRGWVKEILFTQIRKFKPDIVYMHDLSVLNANDLKKIKTIIKLLVGQIACPLPPNKKPLYEYDLIISSFPHYVKMFKVMGLNSEYLRWCIDADIPKIIGKKKKIYNVTYIGGLTHHHSKGNKLLEALARQVKVDFWGYGENALRPTSPIRKNFHGQAWGKKMYEIFAQSKIVVNRHINVAKNYANNMRMFEATGMGALLITDEKKNIGEFFEVEKEVITYKSTSDLVKKVKYCIKYKDESENIARAGQKRTLKDHTYQIRMKELAIILKKYL
jgi:hypothetical protein